MTFAAYDEQAIWGTGATPEAAIEDAAQWVGVEEAADMRATLKTAPMSDELASHVASAGGNCSFDLDDNGTLQVAQ